MDSDSQIDAWATMCHELLESSPVDLSQYEVEKITYAERITALIPAIIDMIVSSYKDIDGGYLGTTDLDRLKERVKMIKIVRNKDTGDMIACSIYREIDNSFKTIGIGSDGTKEGKEAVQAIIKDDIEPYQNWVWAEVSEAIEHYYKKYNGYPLPAIYVKEVLPNKKGDIEFSNQDMFHYTRMIGTGRHKMEKEKVVFGFKNQALADKVMSSVSYEVNRRTFNELMTDSENISETDGYSSERYKNLENAVKFVEQLGYMYDEENIEELTPDLSADLDQCMQTLKDNLDNADTSHNIKSWYEEACNLRRRMPMLVFRTIAEWKALDKQ